MKTTHRRIGELVVTVYDLDAGERVAFTFNRAGAQESFATFTMHAAGSAKVIRPDGTQNPDPHLPGQTNRDRPPVPMPGTYQLEALEDGTRRVCVTRQVKGVYGLPEVQAVRERKGAQFKIPQGWLLALGAGQVAVGEVGRAGLARGGVVYTGFHLLHADSAAVMASAATDCFGILARVP